MFRIKYIIIFLFLVSCSSEQKKLEKCADQFYKRINLNRDKENPYIKILPKELRHNIEVVTSRKVNNFLNKTVSEKLKSSDYEYFFDECNDELKFKEKKFKAKYK